MWWKCEYRAEHCVVGLYRGGKLGKLCGCVREGWGKDRGEVYDVGLGCWVCGRGVGHGLVLDGIGLCSNDWHMIFE